MRRWSGSLDVALKKSLLPSCVTLQSVNDKLCQCQYLVDRSMSTYYFRKLHSHAFLAFSAVLRVPIS
jgi:hypothetical protein